MTNTLDTSPAARETAKPRGGRFVLLSRLRVFVVVALVLAFVAGAYVVHTLHAEKAEERAQRQAEIRTVRVAVIAQAAGHTIYAPAEWGAHEYPSVNDTRIASWGKYGAVIVHLWQVGARDISASTSHFRHMTSLATPESLCQFTAADRKAYLRGGEVQPIRCSLVPGSHARIRVVPDDPQPGATDVLLSVALPEKGRYLNLWAIDETGTIGKDPVAWATGFLKDLEPYDVTGYSVDEIYQGGAELWYAE